MLRRSSKSISTLRKYESFELINGDIRSHLLDYTLKLYKPDVVIHLAGVVGDPECAKYPKLATEINVEGTKNVVEKCNTYNIEKLFFASTCSVYGRNEEVCTEKSTLNPLSHYARTKLKAEEIIRNKSEQGISFRFGTMYGWSPNMRFDLVVNLLVERAVNHSLFRIYDGTQYRPFIHPLEVAMFFESLFEKDLEGFQGEVFNLVSENLSMLELGQLIERTLPYAIMNQVPEKEDNRSYICRCFKAHSQLGFSPRIRVRDGIQEIESRLLGRTKEVVFGVHKIRD